MLDRVCYTLQNHNKLREILGTSALRMEADAPDATVDALMYDILVGKQFSIINQRPFWGILTWGVRPIQTKLRTAQKVPRCAAIANTSVVASSTFLNKSRLWNALLTLFYPFR